MSPLSSQVPAVRVRRMSVVLAHPLTEAATLGVAPAFVALLAGVLTIGSATLITRGVRPAAARDVGSVRAGPSAPLGSSAPAGRSDPAVRPVADAEAATARRPRWLSIAGRVVGVSLLLLAVAAGRFGSESQFDNIASALVIGVGWPAMIAASAVIGGVWAWLNPFDALARTTERLAGRAQDDRPPRPLWPAAVAGAIGWTWWLAGYGPAGLEPRSVGLGLGLYALVTAGACLWVGRREWLSQGEVFTVTFAAITAARRPLLGPVPDAGSVHVLAIMTGGLAYAELRYSGWFINDLAAAGVDPLGAAVVLAGFLLAVLAGAGSVWGVRRWARHHRTEDAVHVAVPWLVVGLALSAAIERDRLWTSVQLLVIRASDPFGTGADLLGTASWGVRAWPHGDIWRLWVQVGVLTATALVGMVVGLRRARGRRAEPVMVLLAGWLVVAVLSVASA